MAKENVSRQEEFEQTRVFIPSNDGEKNEEVVFSPQRIKVKFHLSYALSADAFRNAQDK